MEWLRQTSAMGVCVLVAGCAAPPRARRAVTPSSSDAPAWRDGAEAGSVPPFDRGAAARGLAAVDVSSCATPAGPKGVGHLSMVFAPDGGVSSVRVDRSAFEDTLVGICVAERFRGVRVPAFDGPAVQVGEWFRLE